MKAFFKKLISQFFNIDKIDSKIKDRQNENIFLRNERKSDINRWKKNNELLQDWDERTIVLGSFIIPHSDIIEFGAGNMVLKTVLNNYESYTPSDIINRFEETIVCDLNQSIKFDLSKYNVAVFSGVLEYIYDVEKVIEQLSPTINQIVLSYCCADIVKLSRDKNGWLSDYKKSDLEHIFEKYNYKIENYQEWRSQSLYNLIKKVI